MDKDGNTLGSSGDSNTQSDQSNQQNQPSHVSLSRPTQGTGYPCELSESKVSVPGFICKGQLLFEDNFNSGVDKGKIWTPEIKFPGEPVSVF